MKPWASDPDAWKGESEPDPSPEADGLLLIRFMLGVGRVVKAGTNFDELLEMARWWWRNRPVFSLSVARAIDEARLRQLLSIG